MTTSSRTTDDRPRARDDDAPRRAGGAAPSRVLVTDGEQRAALAIVRSLGAAGHHVFVCATDRRSLAGASRHCTREFAVPDPLKAPGAFFDAVAAVVERERIDLIIPVADPSILVLLERRAELPGVEIPFPSVDAFRAISDKHQLLRTAAELGLHVPRQVVFESPADVARTDLDTLPYPLVLKPSRTVGEASGRRAKFGVQHAADRAALEAHLARMDHAAFPLLLQQRIVGPGAGVMLLRWSGKTLARFAHRRVREKPPSGGVSVYRRSTLATQDLVDLSVRLLDAHAWYGVAMVEYKVERATGTPYLMEINARFWGSLQLAIDAGVDFPRLLVDAALGRPSFPVLFFHPRVFSRWLWGDVDHLLLRLRRSAPELALPADADGIGRVVWDFIRTFFHRATRQEVLRWDDPKPFVRESLTWFTAR